LYFLNSYNSFQDERKDIHSDSKGRRSPLKRTERDHRLPLERLQQGTGIQRTRVAEKKSFVTGNLHDFFCLHYNHP
jgi:hypothetical protein